MSRTSSRPDSPRSVSVTREVGASCESLWAMVSDVTRMGEWSPENEGATWMKGATGPAVGARFQGKNRNGTKTWKTVAVVTKAETGRAFEFDVVAGPFKIARWGYAFEPAGDDTCVVTETWTDLRGALITKIGKPISGVADRAEHNRAGMVTTLDNLAAAVTPAAG